MYAADVSSEERLKVVFLLAYPRSGTTILGNILGELEGFFHIGELHYVWERNLLLKKRRCGCGALVHDCDFWPQVLGPMIHDDSVAGRAFDLQRSQARTFHLHKMMSPRAAWSRPQLREYMQLVASIYRKASKVSGSKVIIDSSKWLPDAVLAGLLAREGIDAFPVHMIRDPRKVVFSRQRRDWRPMAGNGHLKARRRLIAYDALGWTGFNVLGEVLCARAGADRCLRVKYEDFVESPRDVVWRIVAKLGEETTDLPFIADHTVRLGINHTLGGNKNRHTRGDVRITEDGLWRQGLRRTDSLLTATITWPLLLRYGYLRREMGRPAETSGEAPDVS
jgi:hypothetical protein